jgi:hypothetical protein
MGGLGAFSDPVEASCHLCHREERSDEAIPIGGDTEIAARAPGLMLAALRFSR